MIPEMLIVHELVMLILTIQFTRANITEVASSKIFATAFYDRKRLLLPKYPVHQV